MATARTADPATEFQEYAPYDCAFPAGTYLDQEFAGSDSLDPSVDPASPWDDHVDDHPP